jgi:SAM-dependent methyltransferase
LLEGISMTAYDEDLAWIHDVGYGSFARDAAPGVLEVLRDRGAKTVVDIGCGSGIWARQLVDAGMRVVGVDLSPAMIKLARRRVPEAKFQVASWRDYRPAPADAFTALGEVLGYLLDERATSDALEQLLKRIFTALRPGGVLVFDLAEPGRGGDLRPSHRAADDWACLVDYERDDVRQILTRRIDTFRRIGKAYRRHRETHRLQLHDARGVAQRLREIGFRVRVVRAYGSFRLPAKLAGFIAVKPS